MKKTLALILTFIMVLALVPTVAFAAGNTIYVDATNGNDTTGDGTEAKPYKTVEAAAKAAASGDTITLGEGEYTLYNIPSDNTTKGKDLTFIGQGADKTVWNIGTGTEDVFGQGNGDFSFNGSGTIEFQNMTLKAAVINGTGEQVDRNYTGFAHTTNTIVKNCTVNGRTAYWGYTSATFTNTTFYCPDGDYAVWTYSSPTMTFDNCTFNSTGKVINVYTDYGAGKYDITVNFKNCTVNNEEGKSNKAVLNINDYNMGDYKYILNITGDNKVTGVDADDIDITGSRLFGFGGKTASNSGRSDVTINGVKVWENGKRACAHNGVVFPTGSYNGDVTTQYTDGYKDNAFEIIKDDTTGVYVKTCKYCGYTELFYGELSNEIGLTRTVNQNNNLVSADAANSNKYKVANSSGITVDYTATMDMENLEWRVGDTTYNKNNKYKYIDQDVSPWKLLGILAKEGKIDDKTEVILTFKFDDKIDLAAFEKKYNNAVTASNPDTVLKLTSNMFKIADGGVTFDPAKDAMTIKCKWNRNDAATDEINPIITLNGYGLPVTDNWGGKTQIEITNSGCVGGNVHIKKELPVVSASLAATNSLPNDSTVDVSSTIQIPIVGGCKTDKFTLYYSNGGDSGHTHYPAPTPVPMIVIPPKTGDMTIWQSILHFFGIR